MDAGRNLANQLCPVHPTRVANDIDSRQTASLDQVVALTSGLQAAHQAHFIPQLAADANPIVVELVEKLQHAGLQRGGNSAATTTANARDTGDSPLADQVLGAVA